MTSSMRSSARLPEDSCASLMTRYSYAFCKTRDAFVRSFILKELADCHAPCLSLYLLWTDIVLKVVFSPSLLFPAFCQTVAATAPVENLFSGMFFVSFISIHPFCLSHFISTSP